MFTEILFLSLDQMKHLAPNDRTVVVSILDNSEASQRPILEGFKDVLALEFEDTYESLKYAKFGDWPDEPTREQHACFAQGKNERVPTLSDAKKIVDFLSTHHHSPDKLTLVAHCHGGISRSAAVASWASVRWWIPLGTMKTTEGANPRLYALMDKADGRLAEFVPFDNFS